MTTTGRRRSGPSHSSLHHSLGSSPFIVGLLGVLVLFLWLCGTLTQIQTSELLALGGSGKIDGIAWSILAQPYYLLTGIGITAAIRTAYMYGWVVEGVTLVFALALVIARKKISEANPYLGYGFVFGGLVLLILNSWADFSSSPGSTPLVQGLIALAIGGIVVVGLPLGVGLLQHAYEEF